MSSQAEDLDREVAVDGRAITQLTVVVVPLAVGLAGGEPRAGLTREAPKS